MKPQEFSPCAECDDHQCAHVGSWNTGPAPDYPKNALILAYTCNDHLLLDLDHTTMTKARRLAWTIRYHWPEAGGFLLLETTPPQDDHPLPFHPAHSHVIITSRLGGYHAVFLHKLSWKRIMQILTTLTGLGVYTQRHLHIRRFRGDLTLRLSSKLTTKAEKQPPRVADYYPCCDACWNQANYYVTLLKAAGGVTHP